MKTSFVSRSLLVVIFASATVVQGTLVYADNSGRLVTVFTDFENGEQIDPDDGLTIGESPVSAVLTGGDVEIRGVFTAYNSPPHGWVFDQGEVGMIDLETRVRNLTFFAAVRANPGSTDPVNGEGFVTLFNRAGRVIRSPVLVISHDGQFRIARTGAAIPLFDGHPQTLLSLAKFEAALFEHSATGSSFLSLDDVEYTARVRGRHDD